MTTVVVVVGVIVRSTTFPADMAYVRSFHLQFIPAERVNQCSHVLRIHPFMIRQVSGNEDAGIPGVLL